jgi:hypothetical protein
MLIYKKNIKLLVYMALAEGESCIKVSNNITEHT